jgi:uncharacterized protein YndB with AHSA1/START domain
MTGRIDDEIRHATFVAAPREQVYRAFATSGGLNAWFTTGATVEARPGGTIHLLWQDWGPDRITAEDRGTVLEAREPERFVFEWHPDNPSYATTVEIDFEESEGGTIIRLREHGYRDTPEGLRQMLDCAGGWGEALTLWKFWLEHGIRYR